MSEPEWTAEELASFTPAERLEIKMDPIIGDQFHAMLAFIDTFCDALIERGIEDGDALEYAKVFEDKGSFGPTFAALLQCIPMRRVSLAAFHRCAAVFAKHPDVGARGASFDEIGQLYAAMDKGDA